MDATERVSSEDNEAPAHSSGPDSNLTTAEVEEVFSVDDAVESLGFGAFHLLMVLFCGLGWENEVFSIDDAAEGLGFGAFHLLMVLFGELGWLVAGNFDIQISVLSVILKCEWGLSVSQEALITSVYFIGQLFSTQFWGYMADRYGRRRAMYLGNALMAVFGSLTALAPAFGWMLVLRALTAFASGVIIIQVTYLTEIIPRKARGIAVQSLEIFYVLGGILIIGVGMAMVPSIGWRWYLATSAILTLPLMISSFIVPETPRYLTLKGKTAKAQRVLAKIAKFNGKPSLSAKLEIAGRKEANLQLSMIVSDGEQEDTEELTGDTDEEGSGSMSSVVVADHHEKMRTKFLLAQLFKKGMWRTTVLLWLIWLTSTAYYYGTFLLATSLFRFHEHCNAGGIPQLDVCQNLQPEDYIDIIWTTSAELPGVLVFALLSAFLGRRVLMAGGVTLCAFFTGLLYLCQPREVITAFLFCARAFISGASQILYVYTAEVYPTEVRSLGLGIASAVGSAGGVITPYIAQVLLEANDLAGISLFLAMVIACAVAIVFLPIETKGKSLKETGSMHLKKSVCCQMPPAACDWRKNTFSFRTIFV